MSGQAKNIDYTVQNNQLLITVDLSEDLGVSKTGKSSTVGSTYGWEELEDGGIIFNMNVNRRFNGG